MNVRNYYIFKTNFSSLQYNSYISTINQGSVYLQPVATAKITTGPADHEIGSCLSNIGPELKRHTNEILLPSPSTIVPVHNRLRPLKFHHPHFFKAQFRRISGMGSGLKKLPLASPFIFG
jgi:hypothetical protein